MIEFVCIEPGDLAQIQRWIDSDQDHRGKMDAMWWTESNLLNCRVKDEHGSVMYLRVDEEQEKVRLHIQFAPQNEVSKMRVAAAFIDGFPRMLQTIKNMGYAGIVFESTSSSLIHFMRRMGFEPCGGQDYLRT